MDPEYKQKIEDKIVNWVDEKIGQHPPGWLPIPKQRLRVIRPISLDISEITISCSKLISEAFYLRIYPPGMTMIAYSRNHSD